MGCLAVSEQFSCNNYGYDRIPIKYVAGSGSGDSDIADLTMNDLVFASGTQPFGPGSQMCLDFSIIDDQFIEPTERFTICGRSLQNAVVILNNGCTDIKIRDNDGIRHPFYSLTFIYQWQSFVVVLISPSSPNGVYTIEIQREIEISCNAAFPSIVQWASKSTIDCC